MKAKALLCVSILALFAGCATYANLKRYERNFTYEGKTYSVWTADKTSGGRTIRVFMLDDVDSVPVAGDSLAECTSRDIRECERTFGAVLRRFSGKETPSHEGGMGY